MQHIPASVSATIAPGARVETAEIGNLIGELHQLGARGEMPGMDNLQPLAFCFGEFFIVCDFFYDPPYHHAEVGIEFFQGCLSVPSVS